MIRRLLSGTVIALMVGCGSPPKTHYYALELPSRAQPTGDARAVLSVAELSVAAAYDDQRIVYRQGPYRLDYYEYHQWSGPPGLVISDYVRDALAQTGRFRRVTDERSPDSSLILCGRVAAFEEIDVSPTLWVGRVDLELHLEDPQSGQIVWSRRFREQRPLPTRHPSGLAQALSAALAHIVARAAPEIAAVANRTETAPNSASRRTAP